MRWGWIASVCAALSGPASAQGVLEARHGTMANVQLALRAGDCKRALPPLQHFAQRGDGSALLTIGWLSQHGRCVEKNPGHAWTYYERAYAAGESEAALHLAGLASTEEGGRDVAAMLWWARRVPSEQRVVEGPNCDPLPGRVDASEAAFIDALRAWDQQRLANCRAAIGFFSLIGAELRYPTGALEMGLQGTVRLDYSLHNGQFTINPSRQDADPRLVARAREIASEAMRRSSRAVTPYEGKLDIVFVIR
jgi:hypothetical protein